MFNFHNISELKKNFLVSLFSIKYVVNSRKSNKKKN